MFLSREIYTKIHIYAILYKGCRFKQIIFSKYETNIKKNYIQQKPANLRFAPIPPFNFLSSGPLKGQATNFQKNLYLKSYGLDSQLSYLDPCLIIDISKKKKPMNFANLIYLLEKPTSHFNCETAI